MLTQVALSSNISQYIMSDRTYTHQPNLNWILLMYSMSGYSCICMKPFSGFTEMMRFQLMCLDLNLLICIATGQQLFWNRLVHTPWHNNSRWKRKRISFLWHSNLRRKLVQPFWTSDQFVKSSFVMVYGLISSEISSCCYAGKKSNLNKGMSSWTFCLANDHTLQIRPIYSTGRHRTLLHYISLSLP